MEKDCGANLCWPLAGGYSGGSGACCRPQWTSRRRGHPIPTASTLAQRAFTGMAYAPLPCHSGSCKEQLPNNDIMQYGYKKQWGSDGRNDLGVIKKLGGNALHLYHSFGYGPHTNHGKFLDAANDQGLNVLPGVDSDNMHMHKSMQHELKLIDSKAHPATSSQSPKNMPVMQVNDEFTLKTIQ